MFLLLLLLLLFVSASANQCELLKPRIVSFNSLNMNTTLNWIPPESAEGVSYTVTYSEYGSETWQRKFECTNITSTRCDLTNETNQSATTYYCKVIVSKENCSIPIISEAFQPRAHTILGPPKVSLFSTATSILINLSHPMFDKFHIQCKYHIFLNDTYINETKIPHYIKEHLDSHTTYCITAKLLIFERESSMSNRICVTTKRDISEQVVPLLQYILPLVLATLTLFLVAYTVWKYISVSNVSQPHILKTISRNSTTTFSFEEYSVPINIMIIDSSLMNQDMVTPGKDKPLKTSYIHFRLAEHSFSYKSDITDEDSCYGYDKVRDDVAISRPNVSSYDMPHWTDI